MASDPVNRPTAAHIVHHPVVVRSRTGREALAPETKSWIVNVLGGGFGSSAMSGGMTNIGNGLSYTLGSVDVEMTEA